MWFQVLSLIIASAFILKATVALAIPGRFYAARMRQYESETLPPKILVALTVVLMLTAVAWYATFAHYQRWGFLVTGALSALSCMAIHNLFKWERHRQVMHVVVCDPGVWRVDCGLLAIGLGIIPLALYLF